MVRETKSEKQSEVLLPTVGLVGSKYLSNILQKIDIKKIK